ncbi:MAG: hypothetical protein GMKNLPBB_02065 [Myxococcota bacterium]|nr:hypothetical protein [Myxococcota bacterium]
MMKKLGTIGVLALTLGLTFAACGGEETTPGGAKDASTTDRGGGGTGGQASIINLSPRSLSLKPGETGQLTAEVLDANNKPLSGITLTWLSSKPAVATVSSSGLVTAVGSGEASITASADGVISNQAAVTVEGDVVSEVDKVVVTPAAANIGVNESFQFKAEVFAPGGKLIPNSPVSWTVDGGTPFGLVDANGRYSAPPKKPSGKIIVRATSGVDKNKSGMAEVTLTESNPLPVIGTLDPTTKEAGSGAFKLKISGSNFVEGAAVFFGARELTPSAVTATEIEVEIPAELIAREGPVDVVVINPAPGGGRSKSVVFTVSPPSNPAPKITELDPTSAEEGGPAFQLKVVGQGFIRQSRIKFGPREVATSFESDTTLSGFINAADIAKAGDVDVIVSNPQPGGGDSAPITFTIRKKTKADAPAITNLKPSTIEVGAAEFELAVEGKNFEAASVVVFGGADLQTKFVSATELTAIVPAAQVAKVGEVEVIVRNPAPSGPSAQVKFTVTGKPNPVPAISTLSPSSVVAGSGVFTLTVEGKDFIQDSRVVFAGQERITNFVSSTKLQADIPAAAIANAGSVKVAVRNPPPGGGNSAEVTFTITAPNPVPKITSLQPNKATAGGTEFTLKVLGENFVDGARVQFDGGPLSTEFVKSTELSATVTAVAIAASRNVQVTVWNPAPGGGTSTAVTFPVEGPTPVLDAIFPPSALAEGKEITVTITGDKFVSNSFVSIDGTNLQTTFKSVKELTAVIPASSSILAAPGDKTVRVTTPPPGGGTTSQDVKFKVMSQRPVLSSLSMSAVEAGSAKFDLTLKGSDFAAGALTDAGTAVNLSAKTLKADEMVVEVPASAVASEGVLNVTVKNPGSVNSNTLKLSVTKAQPIINRLSPVSLVKATGPFDLTIRGRGFKTGSTVDFGTEAGITPKSLTPTEIVAVIPATAVVNAGLVDVVVKNTGGAVSNPVKFTVLNSGGAANAPVIVSLIPTSAPEDGDAFTIEVEGANFASGGKVNFGGTDLTTTFVSSTRITAQVPAAQLAATGVKEVYYNGTTDSPRVNFTVTAKNTPRIDGVSPNTAVAGANDLPVTVTGDWFSSAVKVVFDGQQLTTTFDNVRQIKATLPKARLAAAAELDLTVTGTGAAIPAVKFIVLASNPVPSLVSLSPGGKKKGDPDFELTVTGDANAFVQGSLILVNDAPLTTTFVNAASVKATVPAAFLKEAGQLKIKVLNPKPGGGASNELILNVTN